MFLALLLSCSDVDDPYGNTWEPPRDDDCFRSIKDDACMEVPHEEDGKHSLCENDTERTNKDCFVLIDGESVHIADYAQEKK